MSNLFNDSRMAEGYANARPAVHPRVIERLPIKTPVNLAADIGCGAGLSTAALEPIARHRIGFDPAESMVKAARRRVPEGSFAVAGAEAIPLASQQVDLISAAGSLNYVDLAQFFQEARRILRPNGIIVAYDFSPGSSFANGGSLNVWFSEFSRRYPWPASNGESLNPEILGRLNNGFKLLAHENFTIPLALTQQAYLAYMLTETNVAHAIESGALPEEISAWCTETLELVFAGATRDIIFHGYFACLGSN